jgi:hypothetical protein
MKWTSQRAIWLAAWSVAGLCAGPAVIGLARAADKPAAADKSTADAAAAALAAVEPAKPNAPAEPAGMTPLFNGKDLAGWDGDTRLWRVEDGVVVGQTTAENPAKGNTFLIWRAGETKDFEFRCSFRIKTGNSGVQYRSKPRDLKNPQNTWGVAGYQAEIENTPGKVGFVYHEGGPGKGRGYPDKGNYLCQVGDKVEIDAAGKHAVVGSVGDKAAIAKAYKPGDWNDYVIVAKGSRIQQWVNGVQTVDLTDNDEKNKMSAGLLALQIHAGPPMKVEFKDARLKQDDAGK